MFIAETFLRGSFTKVLNNFGWVNPKAQHHETPLALSHWSWQESNGTLLLCDIQGLLGDGDTDVYTDPQLHSTPPHQMQGRSDMRQGGIDKFFQTHTCNALCRQLGLKVPSAMHAPSAAPSPAAFKPSSEVSAKPSSTG